ncbi:MAG TPA: glucosaminidase domain-containing protein [Acidimicrobiales bacterium]|nr:glucosaminidase domain-containing protein [Acidimicrobiales bacterium]
MPDLAPQVPTARARRTLGLAALVLGVALAVAAGSAASGQEGEPPADPAATSTTTSSTAPPTTLLPDGDFGIIPPGAEPPPGPEHPPPCEVPPCEVPPGEPGPAPEVPPELAVVILPDPTPGLNAALAAIDVSAAERLVAETGLPLLGARQQTGLARLALQAAVDARRAAQARAVAARLLIDELAVNALMYGDPAGLEPLGTPETLGELRDRALRDVVAEHVRNGFDATVVELQRAMADEVTATDVLAGAHRAEHRVEHAYALARVELSRAIERAEEARNQLGPTILGPSVLDSADLVAWYRTYYPIDPPVAPIVDIIDAYLAVGAEEGVAGDIAFAQAILETGGFRSGHAQGYNFAGIGAYDHCAPTCGFRFDDLESGVRAHVHLLRAYADPDLTTDRLAAPPNPLVAPERVAVRGCCPRWTALTGVWATDTQYDRKVLGIYRLMVETARALDRQQQQ